MDTNLQNKKIELIQWLSTLNDQSLIDKLMKLRTKERTDWWNEISTTEKNSIEKVVTEKSIIWIVISLIFIVFYIFILGPGIGSFEGHSSLNG